MIVIWNRWLAFPQQSIVWCGGLRHAIVSLLLLRGDSAVGGGRTQRPPRFARAPACSTAPSPIRSCRRRHPSIAHWHTSSRVFNLVRLWSTRARVFSHSHSTLTHTRRSCSIRNNFTIHWTRNCSREQFFYRLRPVENPFVVAFNSDRDHRECTVTALNSYRCIRRPRPL